MKYFVAGGGAREHAMVWALRRDHPDANIFCAPGNAGIAQIAECFPEVAHDDLEEVVNLISFIRPDVTIAGPEAGLVAGLGDRVRKLGLPFVGPPAKAARLEGSKAYAKWLMQQCRVPTASGQAYRHVRTALDAVEKLGGPQNIVLKADGLYGGKGVFLPESEEEARQTLHNILELGKFGKAGKRVVVEQRLEGQECSFILLTNGKNTLPLPTSQDYKRRFNDDDGPNTGGMGAVSPNPSPFASIFSGLEGLVKLNIVWPILDALKQQGIQYNGFLYVGLMLTDDGLKVLEFNVRLGDPEASVILPLISSNFAELMQATANGELSGMNMRSSDQKAVTVVLVSGGYPGKYEKGFPISGVVAAEACEDVLVFHAGTKFNAEGQVVTAGGRVLDVVGLGSSYAEARSRAYQAADLIDFQGKAYRTDIAAGM